VIETGNVAAARSIPAAVPLKPSRAGRYFAPTLFLLGLVVLWEVVLLWIEMPEYLLPRPSVIAVTLYRRIGIIYPHALFTATEIIVGYLGGIVLGFLAAMLIFYSALAARTLYPLAVASQTVPKLAIAPLLVTWLGFGMAPKIAIIVILVAFPMLVNTVAGFRSVDSRMIELMKTLSASEWKTFRYIRFPAALPFIFSALKLGTTLAVIGAVVGEWVGSSMGLGYLILSANSLVDTPLLFAVLVALSVIGVGFFGIIFFAERFALWWQAEPE
jgi:NitT/TauT family transport system permease protein